MLNMTPPPWVTNAGTFVSWMRNLERDRPALTAAEVDELVRLARGYGVKIRALPADLAGRFRISPLGTRKFTWPCHPVIRCLLEEG